MRSGEAFADAQRDHQAAIGRRQAASVLPRAWAELIAERDDRILDTVAEKAEALSGYRPNVGETETFLESLRVGQMVSEIRAGATQRAASAPGRVRTQPSGDRTVHYKMFGQSLTSPNASRALVDILRSLVQRDSTRISDLADAVRTSRMAHVGRSPEEINPGKPHIARAVEIAPGWMVGLNIDNRTKMMIVRAACEVWEVRMPEDIDVVMPNG